MQFEKDFPRAVSTWKSTFK